MEALTKRALRKHSSPARLATKIGITPKLELRGAKGRPPAGIPTPGIP